MEYDKGGERERLGCSESTLEIGEQTSLQAGELNSGLVENHESVCNADNSFGGVGSIGVSGRLFCCSRLCSLICRERSVTTHDGSGFAMGGEGGGEGMLDEGAMLTDLMLLQLVFSRYERSSRRTLREARGTEERIRGVQAKLVSVAGVVAAVLIRW